ncbi:Os01g0249050, partial [Oryza sativa Japonica Group]
ELPVRRSDVVRRDDAAVVGLHPERQRLAGEVRVALPVLPPVPAHRQPLRPGALHPRRRHGAAAGDVGDEHQLVVVVPGDAEPDAADAPARRPRVPDGDDAGAVHGDRLPRRLRHVEVAPRRVAPPAGVAGLAVVGRAVVGRRHGHRRAVLAPPRRRGVAGDEVARAARRAVAVQRRAQRRRVRP